jgi:uncharacterized protein (DUF927 family)
MLVPENDKFPYSIKGQMASVSDSNTWSTFEEACVAYENNKDKYTGIGFVFTEEDPFLGIDWDYVRDEKSGYWDQEAFQEIVNQSTYAEISPSGTGAHALLKANKDPNGRNKANGREIYDHGRFFTMTGNIIPNVPHEVNEDNGALKVVQDKIGYRKQSSSGNQCSIQSTMEDDEIIAMCERAANSAKFKELYYNGSLKRHSGDWSRADESLCCIIGFYTTDVEQIDRIFRRSALYRPDKWERQDYSKNTIQNALDFIKSGSVWQGFDIPTGYTINDKGLFCTSNNSSKDTLICRTPVVVSAIGEDIDRDECWYQITFKDARGKLRQEYAKQDQLMKKAGVMEISNKGILVVDKKASDLCTYFSEAIFHNAQSLEHIVFVQNNGWKNGTDMLVAGERLYSMDGTSQAVQINKRETSGLSAKGSLERWKEAVGSVIGYSDIRFKCYCALSSILLREFAADSFFLDHSANTSVGKSFGAKVAFSMIGDAKSLKLSGDSTETYLEERAAMFNDLPLFLDETSNVDGDALRKIVYKISNEKGKGRGKKDGGIRQLNEWKTVVLSTGEKSIVDHDGFSGQEVRVIEIHDELPYIPEEVENTTKAIEKNYGHIIELFMEQVFTNKEELHSKFDQYRKIFTGGESRMINRLGATFSVIAVAGELLENVFQSIGVDSVDSTELIEEFFNDTVKSRPVESYAIKALRDLNDWIESNKGSFVIDDDLQSFRGYKKLGWICGSDYIDIIPTEAKSAMKQSGFDLTTVRDDWIKLGVMEVNSNRNDYKSSHIDDNGKKIRPAVCRINVNKMSEVLE